MGTRGITRRQAAAAVGLFGMAGRLRAQGAPIRIGSTLALTGPLSATAQIHKIVGEIYICLLYTSPSPRDLSTSRMPSSA